MLTNATLNETIIFYNNINTDRINSNVPIYSKNEQEYNFCPFKPAKFKVNSLETLQIYLEEIKEDLINNNSIWKSFLFYKKYLINLIQLSNVHITKVKNFDSPDNVLVSDPRKIFMSIAWLWQDVLMRALFSYPIKSSDYSLFLNLSYLIIDYYFDDPNIRPIDKKAFAKYVQGRILQENKPYDLFSSKFDKAIKIVENEFPRNEDNHKVYSTIYDMFMVEKISMESESVNHGNFTDVDLMKIMAQKGIQTVITVVKIAEIDSKKELNYEQHKFMMKFGFLTQIIDDICDLQNDINSNCNTYYVRMVKTNNKNLDKYTYLAINYTDDLYNDLITNNYFNHSIIHNKNVCDSMRIILNIWLMYGICKNKKYYSEDVYKNLEKYSILSFDDITSIRNNSKPTLLKLLSKK